MRTQTQLRKALPIIQAVLLDPDRRDRLGELDLAPYVKAYLAVAVMLIHHREFLGDDNEVLVPFNPTLSALAERDRVTYKKDQLGAYCRNAGLYRTERVLPGEKQGTKSWKVTLTPTPELLSIIEAIEPWRIPASTVPRYTLTELLKMIDEPNRSICERFIADNRERFMAAAGSTRIHQAWQGGLLDHVVEVMNFAVLYYRTLEPLRRFTLLPPEQQFTLSDALVVMFWHDVEKVWRSRLDANNQIIFEPDGRVAVMPGLEKKADRIAFAAKIIDDYGVEFTAAMVNAWKYVEGIRDTEYTPDDPLIWPLGVICHMSDFTSAREFRLHPLESGEPWGKRGAI